MEVKPVSVLTGLITEERVKKVPLLYLHFICHKTTRCGLHTYGTTFPCQYLAEKKLDNICLNEIFMLKKTTTTKNKKQQQHKQKKKKKKKKKAL